MAREFAGGKTRGRPDPARSGHPALRGVDSLRYAGVMLQSEAGPRREINQARPEATLADRAAEREPRRWRTWLPVPVATGICLAVHWLVSQKEPPPETRSYFVFLWSVLAVALAL